MSPRHERSKLLAKHKRSFRDNHKPIFMHAVARMPAIEELELRQAEILPIPRVVHNKSAGDAAKTEHHRVVAGIFRRLNVVHNHREPSREVILELVERRTLVNVDMEAFLAG